jgi:hypothetical protein
MTWTALGLGGLITILIVVVVVLLTCLCRKKLETPKPMQFSVVARRVGSKTGSDLEIAEIRDQD